MKVKILVILLVVGILLAPLFGGCSSDNDCADLFNTKLNETVSRSSSSQNLTEAEYTALQHMQVVDGKFKINLSKSDAFALGIPNDVYDTFVQEINNVNIFIFEEELAVSKEDLSTAIEDAKSYMDNEDTIRDSFVPVPMKYPGEMYAPTSGFIGDNNSYYTSIYVPDRCRSITISMLPSYIFAGCAAGIYYGSAPFTSGCALGWLWSSGTVTLTPPVSGAPVQIWMRFSCAYGGYWFVTFNY